MIDFFGTGWGIAFAWFVAGLMFGRPVSNVLDAIGRRLSHWTARKLGNVPSSPLDRAYTTPRARAEAAAKNKR